MKRKMRKPRLFISASDKGITAVGLGGRRGNDSVPSRPRSEPNLARRWKVAARRELGAYFAGRLRSFSTACDLGGLPPFTRTVLKITSRIPYGEVKSYRWVAERLRKRKAMRAVGNALARNPIPIIVPCHRVVRSDGTLGGYALGLDWKKRLLDLERSHLGDRPRGRRIGGGNR